MGCAKDNREALRIVRGNSFGLRIQVSAQRMDGTAVTDFDLSQASASMKVLHAGKATAKNFVIDGNDAIVSFDGGTALGWWGIEMSGVYDDEQWRFCVDDVFQIVEANAKANVPSWAFVTDDTYIIAGSIVMSGGGGGAQADWDETDPNSPAFILNKPNLNNYVTTVVQNSTAGKTSIKTGGHTTDIITTTAPMNSSARFMGASWEGVGNLVSNKANKVANATAGDFAGLDASGNLTDSGSKASDFATAAQGAKADAAIPMPATGTTGQVLKKTDDGVAWADETEGVTDYDDLTDKPQIDGVTLVGNKSASDLGLATAAQGEKADTAVQDVSGKADKVSGAAAGDFAGLDANGNLTDSGKKASDFATAAQGAKADAAAPQATTYTKTEVDAALALKASASDMTAANSDIAELQAAYAALTQSAVVVGALPASGVANTIYRVPGTSSYADYMWDGTQFVLLATYDNAIDNAPTANSTNLVQSGGVYNAIGIVDEKVDLALTSTNLNVDLSNVVIHTRRILPSTLLWGASTSATHFVVPAAGYSEGDILGNASKTGYIAFLAEYDTSQPQPSGSPEFVAGTTLIEVPISQNLLHINIPLGTKYLYVEASANNASTIPQSIHLYNNGIDERVESLESDVEALDGEVEIITDTVESLNESIFAQYEVIDFTQLEHRYGLIDISTTVGWASRSQTDHYLIPISGGVEVEMTFPSTSYKYTFLSESPTYDSDGKPQTFPVFATGYSNVVTLSSNVATKVLTPYDAKYLYLTVLYNANVPDVKILGGINKRLEKIESTKQYPGDNVYYGQRIQLSRPRCLIENYAYEDFNHQAGAIYNGEFFFCNSDGAVTVFDVVSKTIITSFTLVAINNLMPHCNAAFFGAKYDETDLYPVLYVNAYNTTGLPKGTLYGYRITVTNGVYSCSLVQTITIGFTTSSIWTDGSGDVRPYGNFVLDYDNGFLYAYTLLDTTNVTRFFAFTMPAANAGDVIFAETDIVHKFDVPYIRIIQDSCYEQGRIFICSGYGYVNNPGYIYVVDLASRTIISVLNFRESNYGFEPEYIDVYDGYMYCGNKTIYKITW